MANSNFKFHRPNKHDGDPAAHNPCDKPVSPDTWRALRTQSTTAYPSLADLPDAKPRNAQPVAKTNGATAPKVAPPPAPKPVETSAAAPVEAPAPTILAPAATVISPPRTTLRVPAGRKAATTPRPTPVVELAAVASTAGGHARYTASENVQAFGRACVMQLHATNPLGFRDAWQRQFERCFAESLAAILQRAGHPTSHTLARTLPYDLQRKMEEFAVEHNIPYKPGASFNQFDFMLTPAGGRPQQLKHHIADAISTFAHECIRTHGDLLDGKRQGGQAR